ncbi:MAG: DUF1987 domain-containing protein [Cytophagales bacterium]|nr:DUF1987 domain-containing protein [Cytophagales bacterium]
MEKISIKATSKTPQVEFDPDSGVLAITGRSIPENSVDFYKPILEWLDDYTKIAKDKKQTVFKFKLEYFNTSSSKCILDIFRRLEKLYTDEVNIAIKWYYEEDDEDMYESGEDFKEIMDIPVELVEIKEA